MLWFASIADDLTPSQKMVRTPGARQDDTSRTPNNVHLPFLPLKNPKMY